jgi:hypothetical protein
MTGRYAVADEADRARAALWLVKRFDLRPSEAEALIVKTPIAEVRAVVKLIERLEVQK